MTSAQDRPRRRRRPRRQSDEAAGNAAPAGPVTGSARDQAAGALPNPAGRPAGNPGTGRREDSGRGRDSERGWRELAGSSPSQVGLGGAMRARDVARPTAADLAAAERDVVVVRRQWQPPEA